MTQLYLYAFQDSPVRPNDLAEPAVPDDADSADGGHQVGRELGEVPGLVLGEVQRCHSLMNGAEQED